MRVPFLDLSRHHAPILTEMETAMQDVLRSGHFIMGPNVKSFESEISQSLGVKHAIGCGSGTDALLLSLMAMKIGPGDEVITTPFTFFATVGCIVRVGARPVFVDIDSTYNLDLEKLKEAITPLTRAIIPVHLYGRMCDMERLQQVIGNRPISVIEDCAQSIGARQNGKSSGAWGDTGCISFFPTKNLGAIGDGGMIITDRDDLADDLRMLRVHGAKPKYFHRFVGLNSRLDELHAAVLRIKQRHLATWNEARFRIATLYDQALKGLDLVLPAAAPTGMNIYHQYPILAPRRDELHSFLKSAEIEAGIYYPLGLHLQECFASLGYQRGDMPFTEYCESRILSLPIFPEMTEEEVEFVAGTIRRFYEG